MARRDTVIIRGAADPATRSCLPGRDWPASRSPPRIGCQLGPGKNAPRVRYDVASMHRKRRSKTCQPT